MAKARQLEEIRIDDKTRPGPPLEQLVADDTLPLAASPESDAERAAAMEQYLAEQGLLPAPEEQST